MIVNPMCLGSPVAHLGWNTADIASSHPTAVAFSDSDKRASHQLVGGATYLFSGRGGGSPHMTGEKIYFEIEVVGGGGSVNMFLGVCSSTVTLEDYWQNQTANLYVRNNGQIWQPGVNFVGSLGANYTAGDVISFACTVGTNVVIKKNNGTGVTIAYTSNSILPAFSFDNGQFDDDVRLLRFAADHHYSLPSGFSAAN